MNASRSLVFGGVLGCLLGTYLERSALSRQYLSKFYLLRAAI